MSDIPAALFIGSGCYDPGGGSKLRSRRAISFDKGALQRRNGCGAQMGVFPKDGPKSAYP